MARIYDITPAITPELAVFPGDTPPSRAMLLDMKRGDHLTLSTLKTTVHLGAHVDGPNHYGRDDAGVDALPIERFLGPAQVIDVAIERGQRFNASHVQGAINATRVLFRTKTYPNPESWNEDFAGMDPGFVRELHDMGVELVGIDTPSVDLSTAKDLVAHHAFRDTQISILEGIVLNDVPVGHYELIALPLRLVDFDASPVRAVLRTLG